MATVGIIANPASGKDIRRLIAYGTVFDNQEKVNIVRRVLLGLAATGVNRVVFMPDYYGIVPKAIEGLNSCHRLSMDVVPADIRVSGTQEDSRLAASVMHDAGVDCIVTLGGDGTNRMVAKSCGDIPLLPVSTGTNNVFPVMVEGTTAGLAAGVVACRMVEGTAAVRRTKKLVVVKNGLPVDMALIDAVVLEDSFIGSRAVWDVERLRQIVLTRGQPGNMGISSIGGNLVSIGADEDRGMSIRCGGEAAAVMAPIAPGLILQVPYRELNIMHIGDTVTVEQASGVMALDGEREIEIKADDDLAIQLTFEGPMVVDVKVAMAEAAARGCFRK